MSSNGTNKPTKYDYLILLPILGLAFYITLIPNIGYPYAIHIDEWVHMAFSKAMLASGNTIIAEPFFNDRIIGLADNMENGFQVFWGVFQQISGIPWLTMLKYFPSVIFTLTVFSVFIMARRQGFGWEAALFTCLIVSNVGIMGPAIFIPVSMALLFVPLLLFVAFRFRTIWSYLVLFIFTCYLMSIHAPSAICVVLIFIPYILISLTKEFKHGLGIALALLGPFLVTLPVTYELVLSFGSALFQPQSPLTSHDLPMLLRDYGYIPIVLSLIGVLGLVIRGNRENSSLTFGLLMIVAMLATFYTWRYGIALVYLRGMLFAMLMMGIIAGAGLNEIRKFNPLQILGSQSTSTLLSRSIGVLLCLVLVGLTLGIAIPARQNTPFYHMIEERDYEAFVWIDENVGAEYQKAVLHPWKATAFTAVTGKYVYTRIHNEAGDNDKIAFKFLSDNCTDTAFLIENGISIVYTYGKCDNSDLMQVRENVYLLSENATP